MNLKRKSMFQEVIDGDPNRVTQYKPYFSHIEPVTIRNKYNI